MSYPIYNELFGKPLAYWADIMSVLETNNINTPEELKTKLTPYSKIIPVYDSVNKNRLLGQYHGLRNFHGTCLTVLIPSRTVCRSYSDSEPVMPLEMRTVEFRRGWRASEDGFTMHAVLTTAHGLSRLMEMDAFTLPRETKRQASERRRESGY